MRTGRRSSHRNMGLMRELLRERDAPVCGGPWPLDHLEDPWSGWVLPGRFGTPVVYYPHLIAGGLQAPTPALASPQ